MTLHIYGDLTRTFFESTYQQLIIEDKQVEQLDAESCHFLLPNLTLHFNEAHLQGER